METRYLIGIDEVGRGPIAGPVAVGAFICGSNFFDNVGIKTPLRDSKKLSARQRQEWFNYLKLCEKEGKCKFKVSYVSPENIDLFGIVKCIQKALDQSLKSVFKGDLNDVDIYLDGGLKAPGEYKNQKTVVKGDEIFPVISCASIVAKVSRDKVMSNYAKEYINYGFDKNMGYGTKDHYDAIKKHGLTAIHRKSFIK